MLRASSNHSDRPAFIGAIVDPAADPLLAAGRELLAFTDAAVLGDTEELPIARAELLAAAGPDAVVRAAACAGNFQMMNRLLDAIGVPVSRAGAALAAELGLQLPSHLAPR